MSNLTPNLKGRTIFLTGASGVVGQALLAKLDPKSVVCLVRQTAINVPNVATIKGDISLPRFGLSRTQLLELSKQIDCIVHAAAMTDFTRADDELMFRTNVQSLEAVFELATLAQVPVFYISTAFVRPYKQSESKVDEPAYTISKREAERLVRCSGLPHVIIRPSIVVGDSISGVMSRFQGIHNVMKAILHGVLPMLPALPDAYVDFIPQDVLADVIISLIDENCVGGEYWITSGEKSLKVARVTGLLKEFAHRAGRAIEEPKFVPPDIFDRLFRPVFLPALPLSLQKRVERLLKISLYLCIDEPFVTSMPELQTRLNLLPLPDLEPSFLRGLDYWAHATGYSRRFSNRIWEPHENESRIAT